MMLICPDCGSVKWTITVEFVLGETVPTLSIRSWLHYSRDNPEQHPKCAQCGRPLPTEDEREEMNKEDDVDDTDDHHEFEPMPGDDICMYLMSDGTRCEEFDGHDRHR